MIATNFDNYSDSFSPVENASMSQDYRLILKEELNQRCDQNPHYSLRAFARDLNIAPSRLSEILNRKQGLSRKAAAKIAISLGFGSEEKEHFCDLVASQHARSKNERDCAKIRLLKNQAEATEYFQLQLDTFKIIADWYHIGILELINLKGFKEDSKWIAKKLRITTVQAELAIERLLRVKLLERRDGSLVVTQNTGYLKGGIPSESIKKFHRQILAKAQDALILQSVQEREFSVNLMGMNKKDLPAAKEQIAKFQQRFCSDIKKKDDRDSLYCLSIQFFNLLEDKSC